MENKRPWQPGLLSTFSIPSKGPFTFTCYWFTHPGLAVRITFSTLYQLAAWMATTVYITNAQPYKRKILSQVGLVI